MDAERLDGIMRRHDYAPSGVIAMLQDLQREERYLPLEGLRLIAERVGIPASRVYSLATFYRSFSLKPRGRHLVSVCLGTACHVRGGGRIMDKVTRDLGTPQGEMTPDGRFTVEPVRCVGCCGLAPVVTVDETFYGGMTQQKVAGVLRRYE
ncbi:MAG: NAD(P)H-dependent oxidoreductase subunit E [Planctomycetes bacterium]|nr:NAD(P)H-dependent oxidoreductase subunit E [Planctomycetota bacterium]